MRFIAVGANPVSPRPALEGVTHHAYGEPDPQWDRFVMREDRVRLSQVLPGEGRRCTYQYDFGDDWQHEVLVEKILPPDPAARYPLCLKGKRACPPEDVGGVWGYADFKALADPNHPEHKTLMEWYGGPCDPEAFDLEMVNCRLGGGWPPTDRGLASPIPHRDQRGAETLEKAIALSQD